MLIREFALLSRESHLREPLHSLAAFVRMAFERYLDGDVRTLDQAFRLAQAKRGGRKPLASTFDRRLEIAREVAARRRAGETRDAAIEAVSKDHGRTFDYVRDAYQDLKFIAKLMESKRTE